MFFIFLLSINQIQIHGFKNNLLSFPCHPKKFNSRNKTLAVTTSYLQFLPFLSTPCRFLQIHHESTKACKMLSKLTDTRSNPQNKLWRNTTFVYRETSIRGWSWTPQIIPSAWKTNLSRSVSTNVSRRESNLQAQIPEANSPSLSPGLTHYTWWYPQSIKPRFVSKQQRATLQLLSPSHRIKRVNKLELRNAKQATTACNIYHVTQSYPSCCLLLPWHKPGLVGKWATILLWSDCNQSPTTTTTINGLRNESGKGKKGKQQSSTK